MRSNLVGLVAGLVLVLGCGGSTSPTYGGGGRGGGGGGGTGGSSADISVANFSFSPTPDTVAAGTGVNFNWVSGTHTVSWDTGPTKPPDSGDISSGTYTTPTLSAGTYTYHCFYHASTYNMRGTIVVK